MDVRKLIPKNKHDRHGITELKKLSFEEIEPIVPKLLEWLQDMNWPVAEPVANVLKPFADRITPQIIDILRTDDNMWKYWILLSLTENTNDPLLLSEIERIAKSPTNLEMEDEVHLAASAILNGTSL